VSVLLIISVIKRPICMLLNLEGVCLFNDVVSSAEAVELNEVGK